MDGNIYFHYDRNEFRKWIKIGVTDGNAGMIMQSIKGNRVTYLSYGTNDNPFKERCTISLIHNAVYDGGPLQSPEYYLKPAAEERIKQFYEKSNFRMVFLDTSDITVTTRKPK